LPSCQFNAPIGHYFLPGPIICDLAARTGANFKTVIAGLDPAIHPSSYKVFLQRRWMRGSSPRMTSWRARTSLLLLQVKFADPRRHLVERLRDHLLEFVRRRRHRDGARLLDHRAVLGGANDRGDLALQQVEDRLRRAGAGAHAEPAETHEVD